MLVAPRERIAVGCEHRRVAVTEPILERSV